MALLHYQNLGVPRPDQLMKGALFGLKTFYDFLSQTRSYMESDAAVKRLAWSKGAGIESDDENDPSEGYWVQLTEPKDRPNEPESTFRDFLDENTKAIYEAASNNGGGRNGSRHSFAEPCKIRVLDRDPETYQLLLGRSPKLEWISSWCAPPTCPFKICVNNSMPIYLTD